MILLSKLQRLFFGKPSAIQTEDDTRRLHFRSSVPYWIVSRRLCLFRCEDFSAIPRGRRHAALEFKLSVWSPFERTGHHAVWSGGLAMVWFWDDDKIATGRERYPALFPKAGRWSLSRLRTLPETMFYPRNAEGLRLQSCADGFELQHWRSNVLVDSLWLPSHPEESQLNGFLARQEVRFVQSALTMEQLQAPSSSRMGAEPWSVSVDPQRWITANRRAFGAACVFALLMVVLWQEVRYWKVRALNQSVLQAFETAQERLTPILDAQSELMQLRQFNLALLRILQEPSQAHLMIEIDRAIPSEVAELKEWRYQQGRLTVLIEDQRPDPVAYVRALETVPMFSQVRAVPAPGGDLLEITLMVNK